MKKSKISFQKVSTLIGGGLLFLSLFGVVRTGYAIETTAVIETYDCDAITPGIQLNAGMYLEGGMNFKIYIGTPSIMQGGQISVRIPSGWTYANRSGGPGYVVANTTAPGVSLYTSVASSGSVILVYVDSMSVSGLMPGDVVNINYQQPTVQWSAQNGVVFLTEIKKSPTDIFMLLSVQPTVDVVAGPPAWVSFETWGLTVKKDTPSTPIRIVLKDNNWVTTKATSPVTVYLSGKEVGYYDTTTYMYIYPDDLSARFSLNSNFGSTTNQITIPVGETGASFYYKTSTSPYSVIYLSYTLQGMTNFQTMWVNVISGGINNASLSGGAISDGGKTSTITGEEGVYINFNTTESNISWQVYVSSSPDRTTSLWTYWGWGIPTYNQVFWNGRLSYWDQISNQWRDEKAPNGTYYVRIQLGSSGGITDDTLKVVVQSYEISGRITEYGTSIGIPYVSISAWGPSYSYTISDSSGYYRLGGLRSGNYYIDYNASGYSREYKSAISAGSSNVNVSLKKPGYLKINARRAMNNVIQNPDVWGGVQIYPSGSYYGGYWASLHFETNVSTSDNGQWSSYSLPRYEIDNSTMPWIGGKWSVVEVVPGTYTLRADLWGYISVSSTVYLGSGEAKEVLLYFAAKKNAYGVVLLPEPVSDSWGAWVSLEAIKSGEQWASAWGYTYIQQGLSSGTFTINGLDAGNYTIRTFAPGFRRATKTISVGVSDEAVDAGVINLVYGGGLSGSITVEGNTLTDPSLQNLWGDNSDPTPNFYLYLNAWSPDSYSYGWTQIKVYKSASISIATFTIKGLDDGTYWVNSWLQGYEIVDAVGWNGVRAVVKDGVGSLNIIFRRYTGRIKVALKVPANDYDNVMISMQGPNLWMSDTSLGNLSMYGVTVDSSSVPGICYILSPPVGSGFYQVKAKYSPTGYEKSKNVMAINGQTRELSIDLTAQTYAISGKLKLSQTNPPQGYSSLNVLLDSAAVYNTFWLNSYTSTTSLFVQAIDYSKMESLSSISGTPYIGYVSKVDGGFTISGLVPGVYVLKVPAIELDGNWDNGKETAPIEYTTYVTTGNVSGIELSLGAGYSVRGEIKLPQGEYATRSFYINVYDARRYKVGTYSSSGIDYVTGKNIDFVNANSASYEIKGLASGEYIFTVYDSGYWDNNVSRWVPRQYANASITVKVESSDLNGQNITLSRGGKITLKLKDADSGTIITPQNKDKMLPSTFQISAMANPWVEGGWATLDTISGGGDSNEQFTLNYLPEAIYDLSLGQSSYGGMMPMATYSGVGGGSNQTNYASKQITGINVKNNQITDLGTIDIRQGLTLTGSVKNKNGDPLPNIPVIAIPSLSGGSVGDISSGMLHTITDINGRYSIVGLNPENLYYDIIACPRIDTSYFGGYYFWGTGGISYGEKAKSMVKISPAPDSVDFVLEEANGVVSGKVITEDGGILQNPSDPNLPTATVFMQPEDSFPRTNPIGDIVANTEVDGSFTIEALSPGIYRLVVVSAGYGSLTKTVTISSTSYSVNLGNLVLERGAKISGKITKPDGKYPSTSEIKSIVALSDDMSEYLFGTLKKSGDKTVSGYELYGFRQGSYYSIMFITEGDEMTVAKTSYSVPFSSYVKTNEDLVLRASAPALLVRARKISKDVFAINFELTGALRKSIPSDDDLSSIITVVSGGGTLSDAYLSPSRKTLSVKYTSPTQSENKFILRLKAYTKAINPETGSEFLIDESIEFYSGISAKNKVRVFNLKGGKITLEGDSSEVVFLPNTFEGATSTSTVEVQFMKGDEVSELSAARSDNQGTSAPIKGGRNNFVIPRAAAAYPARLYKAMESLRKSPVSVNPLSSFYDVFLPRGISRALKKDAKLTIQYSTTSVSEGDNPAVDYNVYYYDEQNNVWLLENKDKTVDAENGTITVSINHTSVFTVIKSNAPVIRGASGVSEIFIYNFPNPFNLLAKEVTLNDTSIPNEKRTITGTMIHFGLPAGVSGNVEIKIYNVAGELVRTLKGAQYGLDNLTADAHYYVEWDGKNDYGKKVASGVYIGRFTVNDKYEKFFKMAVIK